MPKSQPWYPNRELTYGQLYHYIKAKTYNVSPFDKASIKEAKKVTLLAAKEASPNNKMFIKATNLATGLSERSIMQIIYSKD